MICKNADVAQLVERNLAKVGVAGSRPVIRSSTKECVVRFSSQWGKNNGVSLCVGARAAQGAACKAMQSRVQIPPGALLDPATTEPLLASNL